MRIFGKYPTVEYIRDDINAVPFIFKLNKDKPFRLAEPYPIYDEENKIIALDPTRRMSKIELNKFHFFKRIDIEMYHMTLVRRDLRKKLTNVSNRYNYGDITEEFWEKWDNYDISMGIVHPHPFMGNLFSTVAEVPNYFNIDLSKQCYVCCKTGNLMRCSACKKIRYCGTGCQMEDWDRHENECIEI